MNDWSSQIDACYSFFRSCWAVVPPLMQSVLGFVFGLMILFGIFHIWRGGD